MWPPRPSTPCQITDFFSLRGPRRQGPFGFLRWTADRSPRGLAFGQGDVIVSVNGRKITTVDTLKGVLSGTPGEWTVSVNRNGQTLKLSIQI